MRNSDEINIFTVHEITILKYLELEIS